MDWGTDTYRRGALERIEDARILMNGRRYALAMYAAGAAVEGMLRSLHWLKNKEFDDKHDLKRIAVRVGSLGLLRSNGRDDDFVSQVQAVARRWSNTLRFADQDQLERFLADIGEVRRRNDEGEIRRAVDRHYNASAEVVKRCNTLLAHHTGVDR